MNMQSMGLGLSSSMNVARISFLNLDQNTMKDKIMNMQSMDLGLSFSVCKHMKQYVFKKLWIKHQWKKVSVHYKYLLPKAFP